jgi:outer membrane protein TolC
MDRVRLSSWSPLRRARRCLAGACAAGLLSIAPAGATWAGEPGQLPPAKELPPAQEAAPAARVVPICLDTVLRLAEDQNAQIAQARARVQEAYAQSDLAARSWLPDTYVGTAFYRHEGGIATEEGFLVHSSFSSLFAGIEVNSKLDLRDFAYQKVNAERQVWQQKGELSRITSEKLLDAADTYIDLLSARAGEVIALRIQKDLTYLEDQANKMFQALKGATEVEVERVRTQKVANDRRIVELRLQQAQAAAKLAYLLDLGSCVTLEPVDKGLIRFELVDANLPVCDLVDQALRTGPGIQEMEGLLALIHESIERSQGASKYLPVFELHMAEGGFGTGPGDEQKWDNRWDLGLQARWNLTELLTRHERQRALQARTDQAHLAYEDLRGKLASGVEAAREASLNVSGQFKLIEKQRELARHVYEQTETRRQKVLQQGQAPTFTELLLSLQEFATAERTMVEAYRAYDKAQLQLLVLLGTTHGPVNGGCPKSTAEAK